MPLRGSRSLHRHTPSEHSVSTGSRFSADGGCGSCNNPLVSLRRTETTPPEAHYISCGKRPTLFSARPRALLRPPDAQAISKTSICDPRPVAATQEEQMGRS